jgi:glycosyltransferase involved in cell wall biosynthesis
LKIAFIVLTYNRSDTLLQVLNALARQCDVRHEVIIADDGSTKEEVADLQKGLPIFNCPVTHVWHADTGFTASRARNLAASKASADYFVFLDGDSIPNPHFVASHSVLMEPGFFVNGSRVLLSKELSERILGGNVQIDKADWLDWLKWRWNGDANKLVHLLYWPTAPWRRKRHFYWKKIRSCNFGVWREDFLTVNGFDETFQGWGHEDADMVLRLHNAGVHRKNGFCATEVYHLWHKQNSRSNEESNRLTVTQRLHSGQVRAVVGVDDARSVKDVEVHQLN